MRAPRACAALVLFALTAVACAARQADADPITPEALYGRSAALLIGVSKYQFSAWPGLDSIPHELDLLEGALKRQSFEVVRVVNPDGAQLYHELRKFIAEYRRPTDRVLIWFSGHGWTDPDSKLGYLVPADAPDPYERTTEFDERALSMTQVIALAKDINARHALFVFDSCFSGSVFMSRAKTEIPTRLFLQDVQRPVRQFITAGDEKQAVPAVSDLVPAFIDAIEGRADINKDGVVTGSEIGLWIKGALVALGKQTPQYGTILDVQLSRGDIVFFPSAKAAVDKLAPAIAGENPGAGRVVARVNGVEIRDSDFALAEEEIGSNMPAMAPDKKREYLITYLADVILLAKAAEQQKLGDGSDVKRQLAFEHNRVLMEALLRNVGHAAQTDDAMHRVYDEAVKQVSAEEEVRARHILVSTEDEAKAILVQLKKGADFAALAKEKSKDPGAGEGGDLGYFTKEQMVPEFAEAAFKLDKGQISAPVKTQFGWHIIKVEDRRMKPTPTFDQVKGQIETYVTHRAQAALVEKLRGQATIERLDLPAAPAPSINLAVPMKK